MGHALEVQSSQVVEAIIVDEAVTIPRPQLALFAPPALSVSQGDNGCTHADVLEQLLESKRSQATRDTYRQGVEDFFEGDTSPERVAAFLALKPHEIAYQLNKYKIKLLKLKRSEATINNRLAAIRALLKHAHRMGWCATDGSGLVDGERVRAYRDTRGIDLDRTVELMRKPLELHTDKNTGQPTVRALRDSAILALFCTAGIRRGEIHKFDVGDFSLPMRRIMVLGKGRGTQKEPIDLPKDTATAIAMYLLASGHHGDKGPLFRNLDHRPDVNGARLTAKGIYYLVKLYGKEIGIDNLSPHKLRHTFGTQAAIASNGNAPVVQRLMRHSSLNTTQRYIDNVNGEEILLLSKVSDLMQGKKQPKKKR